MKKLLTALLILALCAVIGMILFRVFVTGRISDYGGMENPDYAENVRLISTEW